MLTVHPMYTPDVQLAFVLGEKSYALSSIAETYIEFREPVELPPCEGEVVMTVDRRVERWGVVLKRGASPIERKTRIASLAGASTE
jgi:hypothetical protein